MERRAASGKPVTSHSGVPVREPDSRDAPAPAAPAPTGVRPEIQGLRAVAVLLVVIYHLWPGRLGGGYIGVDVFFVISGFLISGNLLREVDRTGRVSLADFWARRVRRLLPAAFLVLGATGLGVFLFVPHLLWQQFFKEIGAAGLYVENWSLAHDAVDYLASQNAPSPVQHYWTLSAEEQFYIGWPLLVLVAVLLSGARRWHRGWTITAVLGAVTLASLAFSLWDTVHNPSVAYFSTFTRAWEFGAGALLACVLGHRTVRSPQQAALLSWAGLLVILGCALVFTHSTPMPGTAAVLVVVASVAVIAAGHSTLTWAPTRLLTWRPATFLGDISYSMYLWHWPLLIILPYVIDRTPGFLARVLILVTTVVAAWLTKIYVEDPVRTTRRFALRRPAVALAAAAVAAVVLVVACASAWWDVEQETRQSAALAQSLTKDAPPCFGAAARDPEARNCPNPALKDTLVPTVTAAGNDFYFYPGCERQMVVKPLRPCQLGAVNDKSVPHIAVIGDSHSRAVMPALIELAKKRIISIDLFTAGGCIWAEGDPKIVTKTLRDACSTMKAALAPLLLKTARQYDFILTTAWTNRRLGPIDDMPNAIAKAWAPIARQKVPIVAVRDNPAPGGFPGANPNNCLADVSVAEANEKCGLSRQKALDRFTDPYAIAVKKTPRAKLLDMTSYYCDDKDCPVVIGGVNVYRDNSHVTTTYARTMAPYYYRALIQAGVLQPR
jgi:peptidoglycan/LPS O-acetylase OafA/YrhL